MPVLVSRGSVEAGTGVGLQGEVRWGWGSRHRGCEVLRVFGFFGIHNLFIDKETFLDFYLNDKRL
jgi:hypothetical protein